MKITLEEAFGKRNDLKKEISNLLSSATSNLWQDKKLPFDFENGTKMHPNDALAAIADKMNALQILNERIYTANNANNDLLRRLETIKAKISLFDNIVSSTERYPGDKVRNRYWDKTNPASPEFDENELLVDAKAMRKTLETLNEEKRTVERQLKHNNFTITLDF